MDFGAGFRRLTLGAVAVASFIAGGSAAAQQVTGTLGSADATTTINGKQLPPPPPEIRRSDQGNRQGFHALVATARGTAQGRAQRAPHHDR